MISTVAVLRQLVPLAFFISFYTVFLKLSAALGRLTVSWAHSLLFALLLLALAVAARSASIMTGQSLPLPLAVVAGASTTIVLGGWFFRRRATRNDGQPAGLGGGMRLAAILLVVTGTLAVVVMWVLVHLH